MLSEFFSLFNKKSKRNNKLNSRKKRKYTKRNNYLKSLNKKIKKIK